MKSIVSWAALAVMATAALSAQTASAVRSGSYEVGGFVGGSYGIDKFRWMGGGNVTYAINKRILPYGEYSYFPGIVRTFTTRVAGDPLTFSQAIPLHDFHGGVHIRMPIKEYPIVPYAVFGMGVIRAQTTTARNVVFGGTNFGDIPIEGATDFAVNFGGGLRYYINQRFGVRAEAKMYKPTGRYTDPFGKVEFGFFLQLK